MKFIILQNVVPKKTDVVWLQSTKVTDTIQRVSNLWNPKNILLSFNKKFIITMFWESFKNMNAFCQKFDTKQHM